MEATVTAVIDALFFNIMLVLVLRIVVYANIATMVDWVWRSARIRVEQLTMVRESAPWDQILH